jgi:hypothetical protein
MVFLALHELAAHKATLPLAACGESQVFERARLQPCRNWLIGNEGL